MLFDSVHHRSGDQTFIVARYLILLVAYAAGIGTNVAMYRSDVLNPALRWSVAFAVGYVTFLLAIRIWLMATGKLQPFSSGSSFADGVSDLQSWWPRSWPSTKVRSSGTSASEYTAEGGRFGGAGASAAFAKDTRAAQSSGGSFSLADTDLSLPDDVRALPALLAIIVGVVVAAAALSVFVCAIYMFTTMPHLLAEAAFAAISTGRAARNADGWFACVVKRSCVPAIITALALTGAGLAIAHWLPNAHTLGEAVSVLLARVR